MLRLSRELISALRLSFEAWPNGKIGRLRNMLSREFRRGFAEKAVVHASNRGLRSSFFIRGSQTRLRQSDYELGVRDGFDH